MKMKKQNGITLIALIITIILMLILASVVLNITLGENGLFKTASDATQKYKIEEMRERVEIAIADVVAKEMSLGNEITIEKVLQELLENGTFENIDKEADTGIIGKYDITLKQNEDGSIVIESIEESTGVRITYKLDPLSYTNAEKISILFNAQGEVKKVTKPDGDVAYPSQGKVSLNYQVDKNGTYTFVVENEEGTPITKNVIVDTIDRLPPLSFTITASQVENKLVVTANAVDAEPDGVSVKSGIDRYEYFVKKSTDTAYPETPYTTNEIEISEYATYNVYVKAYDKAGNSIPSSNEVTVQTSNPKVLKYGQKVNYSANGVNDWKIFYINEERNETFIITSGYLPSAKVPTAATGMYASGTYGASWNAIPSYVEITNEVRNKFMMSWSYNKTNNNIKCVSRILDTSAWSVFVTEELKEKGATAIGSPTLEMFIASWNDVYPNNKKNYYTTDSVGYKLSSSNAIIFGVEDELYLPHKSITEDCRSWYLASPESQDQHGICGINYSGSITRVPYWQDMYSAVRPVVCIPSDLLEYDAATSSWNIK